MKLLAILKKIIIKNNDVDSYATISFEINNTDSGLDLNELNSFKHKTIVLTINEDI